MARFSALIFVLGATLASATDGFTTVYEWNKMDFDWPSEENKLEAARRGFLSEQIIPRFMAVFGERLFLSLVPFNDASLSTLVWLPTNTTSTSPKINPYPSWEMHGTACDQMQEVRGLKVDSDGRLWALDDGRRDDCLPKLWIFDLSNDSVSLVHQFPEKAVSHSYESRWLHDIELDQWNGDWLAYILDIRAEALVVFSLDKNKSWRLETHGKPLYTIALSPKGNERQLYIGESRSKAIYAISVAELRAGSRKVQLNPVGNWSSRFCYKMMSDSAGFLYAGCEANATIFKLDSRDFLQVERYYQDEDAFEVTFSLDTFENFWMMATVKNGTQRFNKLLVKSSAGSPRRIKRTIIRVIEPAPTPSDLISVFEWDEFDFWSSKEDREKALSDKTFVPDDVKLHYIAVKGHRIFLGFPRNCGNGVPVTLAWIPTKNAFSARPKLLPYPSWQMQKRGDCIALQDVRGLQVDSLGRLWVVDDGRDSVCRPKLWIFNSNDQVELVYEFPGDLVSRHGTSWLTELALDETPDDFFAYIADTIETSTELVVFSLKAKKSWRVKTNVKNIDGLALSPLKERKNLYFGSLSSQVLYSVLVKDLRAGVHHPTVTFVGNKTAPSRRMAMDRNGRLYFDLVFKKSIGTWDTNFPFKEEILFTDSNVQDIWPYFFVFDTSNNLFLMAKFSSNPKHKLFKAAVEINTKSYFFDNCTTNQDLDFCRVNDGVCKNGGSCVSLGEQQASYRCECASNFSGRHCEVSEAKQVTAIVRPAVVDTNKTIETVVFITDIDDEDN